MHIEVQSDPDGGMERFKPNQGPDTLTRRTAFGHMVRAELSTPGAQSRPGRSKALATWIGRNRRPALAAGMRVGPDFEELVSCVLSREPLPIVPGWIASLDLTAGPSCCKAHLVAQVQRQLE